ncbi:4Fe-4S binding protein [Bacteroidales bacterium OttesenSCG-928-L14]|nr:4Fe-4S binding protein [Bacteroidales bacterium OttesenSCG-928-L14]
MNNNSNQNIYHAIYVDRSVCVGCTACLKDCPTKAIRVVDGIASIDKRRCVDCGNCMRACKYNAIKVKQGSIDSIFNYKYRVALIPTVLTGQFKLDVTSDQIYQALHKIGFTHVFEEEMTSKFQMEAIRRFQKETNVRPVISSFCPAIVRLIQVRFPMLTENLVLIKSLIDITAMSILDYFKSKNISEDEVGIFYITPCAAKMVAVVSPVGDEYTYVTETLNLDMIYDLISKELLKINDDTQKVSRIHMTSNELKLSLTGGEAKHAFGRSLSIDGLSNVTEFLDKVDNEAIDDIDFLELRACYQSCPGGILCPDNSYLAVEKIQRRAKEADTEDADAVCHKGLDIKFDYEDIQVPSIKPRQQLGLDENISVALQKMAKMQEYLQILPGFDCGVCGSPDCQSLATDVVNGNADLSNCIILKYNDIIRNDDSRDDIAEVNNRNNN